MLYHFTDFINVPGQNMFLFLNIFHIYMRIRTYILIRTSLTNTYDKMKFKGEGMSRQFGIKTGVRQGDGLSPLLFNCIWEKMIREWRKAMNEENITGKIRLGYKKNNLPIDCLAFADDLAIVAESMEMAKRQIELLKEQTDKAGLQISFEKNKFWTNIAAASNKIKTEFGPVKRVNKFKYLGELIDQKGQEKKQLYTGSIE